MGDNTAFFYGTLMAREILYRVCYGTHHVEGDEVKAYLASQLKIQPAILHDHCRHRVLYCDYPGMIPEKGQSVRGTYVSGLTEGDIIRLDQFEGSQYDRVGVKVKLLAKDGSEGVEELDAQTYVFTDHPELHLEKVEWDFEEFRRQKMYRWVGNTHEYDEVVGDANSEMGDHDPTGGRGVPKDTTGAQEKEGWDVKTEHREREEWENATEVREKDKWQLELESAV